MDRWMISLEMEMDGFVCVCVETVLQTVEGGITLLTSRMSCTLPFVVFSSVCLFVLQCFVFFGCGCFCWLLFFSCFC